MAKSKTYQTAAGRAEDHKKAAAKKKAAPPATTRTIAENRKARHNYDILDSVDCGFVLQGSEVKSLRNGKCSLDEAYARPKDNELFLIGCDIPEYKQAAFWGHTPRRPRKLLAHRRELNRLLGKSKEKGLTLVPLRMFFSERNLVKCTIALCKGRQLHDKRQVAKAKEARREIERAVRRRQ